jgi:hypothetical protein
MVADCAALLLPWFGVACALLVVAGATKLRSPSGARGGLSAVGLTVPNLAIRALGAAEIAIGCSAALGPTALTGAMVAALYGAFTAFVVASMRSGKAAPCGCFGAPETEVGPVHAASNVAACAVAIAAVITPPHGFGWVLARAPLTAMPLMVGIAGATLAAYLAFTALPGAWRAYGVSKR